MLPRSLPESHESASDLPRSSVDLRTLAALLFEWTLVVLTIAVCARWTTLPLCAAGFVVIATRQHAVLMLYHDAVHGLLARDRRVNDALINALAGIPFLLPVEVFRPLHIRHHRRLGKSDDPERTVLFANQRWAYRALPALDLLCQALADLFLVNGVRTLRAWRDETPALRIARSTWVIALLWAILLIALFRYSSALGVLATALWFGPVLTLTNLLQKVRSFAEHGGIESMDEGGGHANSWRPGLVGQLTIWPYNISHHHEHHASPESPWHRLPAIADGRRETRAGRELCRLLLQPRERGATRARTSRSSSGR